MEVISVEELTSHNKGKSFVLHPFEAVPILKNATNGNMVIVWQINKV